MEIAILKLKTIIILLHKIINHKSNLYSERRNKFKPIENSGYFVFLELEVLKY